MAGFQRGTCSAKPLALADAYPCSTLPLNVGALNGSEVVEGSPVMASHAPWPEHAPGHLVGWYDAWKPAAF